VRVRFFGSNVCEDCAVAYVLLNKSQVPYVYIDALDPDEQIQDFCDEHNVGELPHLQFLNDDDEVVTEHVGPIDEETFLKVLVERFPQY
jgi:hypothetical protein